MAPPSKRFEPIQRVASDRERKAATALGESLKVRQEAEHRLGELRAYYAEYLERYRNATLKGLSAAQMRDYQIFIDKLEQAISQQEQVAVAAQQQCDTSKNQWRDKYTRTQVMNNVVDKLRTTERQATDKREQSDQDERNQRRR